jgi:pilus assembly protein CpaB
MIGLVALALAGFVSLSIYRLLSGAVSSSKANALTTVVVAATDLPPGTKLNEGDLRLAKIRRNDMLPGSFAMVSDVVGRAVRVSLTKGAPVLDAQLAASSAGSGLPVLIPAGMRAVAVKVNDVTSVAGFVTPGTHVDVLLTGQPGGQTDATVTTVLENVEVLAAGQRLQHNNQGDPQQVTVITLLVSPEDAEKLALATQEGKIQLSLRNPLDDDKASVEPIRNVQLYGGVAAPVPSVHRVEAQRARKSAAAPTPAVARPYEVEVFLGPKKQITTFEAQKDTE